MPRIHNSPLYIFLIIAIILEQISIIQEQQSNPTAHLLAQPLAQAEGSRPGEPPSPKRGLEKGSRSTRGISLRRDPSRLGEMLARSKSRAGRLGDLSCKSFGRVPVHLA